MSALEEDLEEDVELPAGPKGQVPAAPFQDDWTDLAKIAVFVSFLGVVVEACSMGYTAHGLKAKAFLRWWRHKVPYVAFMTPTSGFLKIVSGFVVALAVAMAVIVVVAPLLSRRVDRTLGWFSALNVTELTLMVVALMHTLRPPFVNVPHVRPAVFLLAVDLCVFTLWLWKNSERMRIATNVTQQKFRRVMGGLAFIYGTGLASLLFWSLVAQVPGTP